MSFGGGLTIGGDPRIWRLYLARPQPVPLQTGARLGPYEILALIGAGGMGEVYRARDAKLNRDVAIKLLPELSASDSDRVARFQREAQLLAALNHPHIGAIYGSTEDFAVSPITVIQNWTRGTDA